MSSLHEYIYIDKKPHEQLNWHCCYLKMGGPKLGLKLRRSLREEPCIRDFPNFDSGVLHYHGKKYI